ncbi:SMI1/KNR4 family protein [Streptomyces coelicoflavus]|uniref:SMI1/KNR4 family protein n=1 Tax=Streptomyces coelicoflavus TaxID=285562 RepID=A0A7K3PTE4_9ACTN|nr:SMI1/KNR4 family protein [Streptomyces coelicoflavus]NEB13254.1 SMI1/KNR4 family protein [Streptomyces coelicoflavus]
MEWVRRLAEAVGRDRSGVSVDWPVVERRLGTALPADYKAFCETFGRGEFQEYLTVYSSGGGTDAQVADIHEENRQIAEEDEAGAEYYLPQGLYRPGSGSGLLQWGASARGDEFFWLADDTVSPNAWTVLARDDAQHARGYDMCMSEFVHRLLADEAFEGFAGFGATRRTPPFYTPYPL